MQLVNSNQSLCQDTGITTDMDRKTGKVSAEIHRGVRQVSTFTHPFYYLPGRGH